MKQQRRQRCSACWELTYIRVLCVKCGRRFCKACAHKPHCETCHAPCMLAGKKVGEKVKT